MTLADAATYAACAVYDAANAAHADGVGVYVYADAAARAAKAAESAEEFPQ